jgi:3-methylcrotonyl-CoA carboxylase alpha subunit
MRTHLRHRQQHVTVDLQREGKRYRVGVDGSEHDVRAEYIDAATLLLTLDGQRYRVAIVRRGRERLIAVGGEAYTFAPEAATTAHQVETVAAPEILAPMPGKVLQVLVRAGDEVVAGDALVIVEAMKMETRLVAEAAGTVAEVRVAAGDMVDGSQVLIVVDYHA